MTVDVAPNKHHRPARISDWSVGMLIYVRRKYAFERVHTVRVYGAHSEPI
jgi:hypothetical protein